jgi:RND family efflux transporter MFP subunit
MRRAPDQDAQASGEIGSQRATAAPRCSSGAQRAPVVLLVLLLAPCGGCKNTPPEAEGDPKPIVSVKVATAELADLGVSLTAPATIFPRERVSISSNLTVPIRALYARKGDKVSKGQLLALLEDRDLLAQKGEAAAAVRQAEVLRTRRAELYAQGAIPQRDLLAIETEYLQSKARLDRIQATLRFTELRSPFAGVIVEQQLYAGDVISPSTPVFTVVDVSVAVARAQVPAAEVGAIHPGVPATFTTEDAPDAKFAGRVSMVNQAVDAARRTVEVWCEIDNKAGALRDGTFGQLAITTETPRKRVVVPRAAVLFEGGETSGSVMIVAAEHDKKRATKRPVEVAAVAGDRVGIGKGVAAGELVVTEGGFGLPDGTEVRIAPGDAAK